MPDRIKRVTVYCVILAMSVSMLGGCGLISPTGLNDNDEELVAEYAAGVLMRYSADKKGGFGNPKPTPKPFVVPENTDVPDEPAPADETPPVEEVNGDVPTDDEISDAPSDEAAPTQDAASDAASSVASGAGIPAAIGIPEFEMAYKGYETADIYPKSDGSDLTFSMQAAPGKELVVLHFDVKNPGGSDAECNVLDQNVKFRILVNESERINEQMTILLNDLKSYKETIGAGQTADTVLVFEADTSVAESIGSLSLIVVNSGAESSFSLM